MNGSFARIAAIAENTIRESLRNRVLYALIGATGLVMLVSLVLGWVTVSEGQKIKVIVDFGLSSITLFGSLSCIFLGTNLVYQEVERRTVYTLLARPLSRHEFILGKYLGLVGVNAICLAAMGTFFVLFLMANGGGLTASIFAALYFIFIELCVVTGIAMLLSVTAHPIEGALFSLVLTASGHFTQYLLKLGEEIIKREKGEVSALASFGVRALEVAYYILPNLENFNARSFAAHGLPVPGELFLMSTVYGLLYSLLLFALVSWAFARRSL